MEDGSPQHHFHWFSNYRVWGFFPLHLLQKCCIHMKEMILLERHDYMLNMECKGIPVTLHMFRISPALVSCMNIEVLSNYTILKVRVFSYLVISKTLRDLVISKTVGTIGLLKANSWGLNLLLCHSLQVWMLLYRMVSFQRVWLQHFDLWMQHHSLRG